MQQGKPRLVRVSIGSANILGLAKGRLDTEPTTIYLLTYKRGRCSASCAFCPQSRISEARANLLSRIVWPAYQTDVVCSRIAEVYQNGIIKRTCIQALNYPSVQIDLLLLVRKIHSLSEVPISVSCQPLDRESLHELAKVGVERVSIALDAVTKDLFDKVKGASVGGRYSWEWHLEALEEAVRVFGKNHVTTHLIAGLGENEEDLVSMIQRCVDMGLYPALFAFTPIPGTVMADHPAPPLAYYRRLQIAHYLITNGLRHYNDMKLVNNKLIDFGLPRDDLQKIISRGDPFKTSGCPGCNRPYYNERPGGTIYNFPKQPSKADLAEIDKVLCI